MTMTTIRINNIDYIVDKIENGIIYMRPIVDGEAIAFGSSFDAVALMGELARRAQEKLRATQENWHEQCLFECDDFLTTCVRIFDAAGGAK